ncbi:MAG: efflux transporter periplasmic adaptor subunit [Deltaproteobacteria bacterium HGW-Deltaproteobacteria-21]|nr:MAG: efflux transporter periplasmic adaptor subunit [Deltaproteobacteria bacterium HGW-Deltaproteobacteria-21]
MKKRIILVSLGLLILVGLVGTIKVLQIGRMAAQGDQAPPPETVTTAAAKKESWEVVLNAIGSLQAVQGVMITAELPGKVVKIAFEPGSRVKAGDLLVQQDTSTEEAQLRVAEAGETLAQTNFKRLRELLARKIVSRSEYDNAEAQCKQAAQSDNIRALIAKKSIRAPFSGRLGIRLIDLGQVLDSGQEIVSLQSLDPIFVDFLLPQQVLGRVRPGLPVRVTTDALPDEIIEGEISAINPQVDPATRNIRIQATAANTQEHLRPGMFVNVGVVLPVRNEVLAIPATSVLYAPYSDSVFILEEKFQEGRRVQALRQQFVRLGEKRGDFVSVASGVNEGDVVVSTGVFKLRNGQEVVVDNTLAPEFHLAPKVAND